MAQVTNSSANLAVASAATSDHQNEAATTVPAVTLATASANSAVRPSPMSRLNTSGAEIVSLPRQFGAGQTAIVLPNQHADVLHFALDIGGEGRFVLGKQQGGDENP